MLLEILHITYRQLMRTKMISFRQYLRINVALLMCFQIDGFGGGAADDYYQYDNWKFHFLPGSGMGLFLAVALPLDVPHNDVYLAYNFEANYALPANETSYEFPPLIQRSIDRNLIYNAIEMKLQSNGYPGRPCLLRTICEAALYSVKDANGVLGDILHIIFTPTTSKNPNLITDYEEAEKQGGNDDDCSKYHNDCTISLLNLVSWIGQSV